MPHSGHPRGRSRQVIVRIVLLCHAVTEGVRLARFGADDPPTAAGLADARALVTPRAGRISCAPSTACRATASTIGPDARVDERLRGCDYGRWSGKTLDEVLAAEPRALSEWLADPTAAPHGGESLAELGGRVGRWVDDQHGTAHTVLAVADAAVIRAAVVHAIEAGPRSVWRIDVSPLTRTVLAGEPGRWSLRELGR
jgi:broad specificity phosphatase PhoE